MQLYYNKFKESFPNITQDEFNKIYNYLEHEGFMPLSVRFQHEVYTFFVESKKNYDEKVANKSAEIDTAQMFDISRSRVRQIKSHFVKNY